MSEEIIFPEDTRAATKKDVVGWVSRNGYFFGNGDDAERSARWDGSTHKKCDCGNVMQKLYTLCDLCRYSKRVHAYNKREKKKHDGFLFSEAKGTFFENIEDAKESLLSGETLGDLMLIVCDPVYARQIDEDYYFDDMPEEGDLPDELKSAMEEFNKKIEGVIVSWAPGEFALEIE